MTPRNLSRLTLAAGLAITGCAWADANADRSSAVAVRPAPGPTSPYPSGPAYRTGVVSVANPYAAEAGARILERGGNAVDAAVAIVYALNVVEPQSAGVGGGGFMMIHLSGKGGAGRGPQALESSTFAIDSRERAPAGATPTMFAGVPNPSLQGVAVGVPGMVRGTELALDRFGRLGFAQVLAPAIKLADEGFAATARYAAVSCNSRSQNSPESAAFFCPNGAPPVEGSLVQNKDLAETFRLIARHGADCFYKLIPEKGCDIARGIVDGQTFTRAEAGSKGGSMTYDDLAAYKADVREPTAGAYRGWKIKAMSPPSSGGLTLLQMLGMLERFPIGDKAQGYGFASVNTATVMASAMRIAFADRSIWMGDADFVPVPQRGLLDPTYVAMRGAPIVPGVRLDPNPVPGDPRPYQTAGLRRGDNKRIAFVEPVTGPGETTTHLSVIDRWGNLVTYTNTIESSHGIGVFAGYKRDDGTRKGHGFLLNNELTDFNLAPTTNPYTGTPGYNDVQPGKRPRSSMVPTLLLTPDGEPFIAYGSPGGASIINSVLNVTLNLIDHKMNLQQAVDAPRLSITSAGVGATVEGTYPVATADALRALGYTLSIADIGSVQAVLLDPTTGRLYGAADARREGTVIGLPRRRD
jgi:gamma-glutamyltranspeptidase / glutathione hydrolase